MRHFFTSISQKNSSLIFATTLAISLINTPVLANSPTEAFQRAEYLGQIVERLLHSDLQESVLAKDPALSPSRPRHVLRMANYTYENIQFLRSLNGLSEGKPIKTSAKEVVPADVIDILDAAIEGARALGTIYKVDLSFAAPPISSKKKPDDVLARLRAVNDSLKKLGAPLTLPNDVYRISLGINEQAKSMTKAGGISVTEQAEKVGKAKPADALDEVFNLIHDLEKLSASNEKYALPNGVAIPPAPKLGKPVTPTNVLLATQFALADVYSINVSSGHKTDLELPPIQAGRNPADVKNILAEARVHIKALTQSN